MCGGGSVCFVDAVFLWCWWFKNVYSLWEKNILNLYREMQDQTRQSETTDIFFQCFTSLCCSKTNGQDWMTVLILVLSDGYTPFMKRQTDRKMWLLFFFLQGLRGGVCSIHRWFKGTAIKVSLGRVFTAGETQEWRSNGYTKFSLTFCLHPAYR